MHLFPFDVFMKCAVAGGSW